MGAKEHVSQQEQQRHAAPSAALLTAGQHHPAAAPVLECPAPRWTACTRHCWQLSHGIQSMLWHAQQ